MTDVLPHYVYVILALGGGRQHKRRGKSAAAAAHDDMPYTHTLAHIMLPQATWG